MQHSLNILCAGQGFGNSKQSQNTVGKHAKRVKDAAVLSGDSKAVKRAVRFVEEQEGRERSSPGARPVDAREAARGKVEYVKVKDWGSGEPQDLGSLQVQEGSNAVFEPPGDGAAAQPFHEVLARRLELLQRQGALGVAPLPGGKPLPDFQRWAFAPAHYQQYLVDMHALHAALERSIADIEAELEAAQGSGSQRLLQAIQLFGREQGLARSAALQHDLQQLAAAGQQARQQMQQQQEQRSDTQPGRNKPGETGNAGGAGSPLPHPTSHAAAYAAYLSSLARQCRTAEGAGQLEQAVLRLLANAYVLYLMHLTSGGRIAAAAAQRLDLAALDALYFYQSYPELDARLGEGAKPLEAFVSSTNRLGEVLPAEQQDALMEELGKAMTKTSMLLVPLAREA